jgi:hypothetical protein
MFLGCTVLHTLLMLYAYSMVKPAYHLQTILIYPLFASLNPPPPSRWVRNLDEGLRLAWLRHEEGQAPDHIDVPDMSSSA